jgi:hypothetical protein
MDTKKEPIKQSQKGTIYHFSLDRETVELLKDAMGTINVPEFTFSQSPIIRRAIRLFHEHVLKLKTSEQRTEEHLAINRARRGLR